MKEEWRSVIDYEGLYEVSSCGQIKSLRKGALLTPHKINGYYVIRLCKNGKMKNHKVHRLVAIAFIPNPENKAFVDHINGVRDDNRLENLRWCTNQENQSFELARLNNSKALTGRKQSPEAVAKRAKTLQKSIGKKVNQYTLDGEFVASYNSFNEARRLTGVWDASVRSCCIGRFKQAGGYIWRFAPEVTFENSPMEVELVVIKK